MQNLNTLNSPFPIFSLQSFLKVTNQVSYTHIYKKYWVNMHTFVSQKSRFQTTKQNNLNMYCALLQNNFLPISWFCNLYFLLPLLNIWKVPQPIKMSNTELAGFRLTFFPPANPVTKRCHTVSVLYRPNFQLPSNTAPNFYSPHVVTRYCSITTTEIKLLCASLIQFIYVPVSIQG